MTNSKDLLDSAVREYESALMRNPIDEDEIRRAVDRCADARKRLNEEKEQRNDEH